MAAQTGLLPTPPTPVQINQGLSLWLDEKRGSRHQAGTLSAGQPFTAIGSQGEWVQIAGGGWVNAHYVTAN
ncbi:SH3 domain-containing protein [Brevundimonas vesicularis]